MTSIIERTKRMERAKVPCNGCTICCKNDLLILHPECGDDPSQYETMECINPVTGKPALALKHKQEGGCIYLGQNGCTIHERAPAICKEFDCRRFYQRLVEQTTRNQRQKLISSGMISKQLLREGRKRLASLEEK